MSDYPFAYMFALFVAWFAVSLLHVCCLLLLLRCRLQCGYCMFCYMHMYRYIRVMVVVLSACSLNI